MVTPMPLPSRTVIRPEQPRDQAAIHDLTERAFAPMPYAAGNEQELIDALRQAGALTLSLVAELDHRIVGHVAFSPATVDGAFTGWYGLGPVAVEPHLQRQRIGSVLITHGLAELAGRGAAGCILVGNPAYYRRFAFRPAPACTPLGEPAEYFMLRELGGTEPAGRFAFHPAFHPAG